MMVWAQALIPPHLTVILLGLDDGDGHSPGPWAEGLGGEVGMGSGALIMALGSCIIPLLLQDRLPAGTAGLWSAVVAPSCCEISAPTGKRWKSPLRSTHARGLF